MSAPATAPRRRMPRTLPYWIAAGVCVAAVVVLLAGALGSNIQYYRTVSEAVRERDGGTFRLAGEVVPGSVTDVPGGVQFDVTDGTETVTVVHTGDEPGMFADARARGTELPVVCQGRWSSDGRVFESDLIMVRHGNEYSPPDVEQPDSRDPPDAPGAPGSAGTR